MLKFFKAILVLLAAILLILASWLSKVYLKNQIEANREIYEIAKDYDNAASRTIYLTMIQVGDLNAVKKVIKINPKYINAVNEKGNSGLHFAGYYGKTEIAEFLIPKGADLNLRNKDGQTPLFYVLMFGKKDMAKFFISKGADVNIGDSIVGATPLCLAAESGDKEMVELLISKGANVNVKTIMKNDTPLHFAAGGGHTEIAGILISKGAEINAKDKYDDTPLARAKRNGNKETEKLLISKGARVYDRTKDIKVMKEISRLVGVLCELDKLDHFHDEQIAVYKITMNDFAEMYPPATTILVDVLQYHNPFLAEYAAKKLGQICPEAIPYIVDILKNDKTQARGPACLALGEMGPKAQESIPYLVETLNAGDCYITWKASWALSQIGPAAIPALINAIQTNQNKYARELAILSLSNIKPLPKEALSVIMNASKNDSEEYVRSSALKRLKELGQ